MIESAEEKKSKRRFFIAITWTVIASFIFFFSLPTMIFIFLGGYRYIFPHKVYSIQSPDNKYVLDVSKRVSLPVFSPLDAAGVIDVSLKDASDKSELGSVTFDIHEFDELTKPRVTWKTGEVYIESIEYHNETSFTIPLPNN